MGRSEFRISVHRGIYSRSQNKNQNALNQAGTVVSFGGIETAVKHNGLGRGVLFGHSIPEIRRFMSSISIIGLGGMGRAVGARAVAAGHAVEVIGRDPAKAGELAAALGGGATAGTFGAVPAGDIVIIAVPHAAAVPVVAQYGNALAGKVIVDITNPMKADVSGLTTPDGTSAAQQIAAAAPADAHVVKAFNTVFGHVLALGRPLDVLVAG